MRSIVAAGHRIPGGFSQERELWVHLRVTDDRGRVLYEVGRVDRADDDLAPVLVALGLDDDLDGHLPEAAAHEGPLVVHLDDVALLVGDDAQRVRRPPLAQQVQR